MPTYQDLLDGDSHEVPDVLRREEWVDQGTDPIDVDRYLSQAAHDLEMERMWSRVWQMACREDDILEPGDSILYEIGDASLIVIRGLDGHVRAFHNSCLHRGRQLRTGPGRATELRCPFHGFTWDLEGTFVGFPSEWDFDHLRGEDLDLPQARVDIWDGWVFVNLDLNAVPLRQYLGGIVEHYEGWEMGDRVKVLHIVKHLRCNWKLGLEAFLESYHVVATHPQLLINLGDENTEYDIYEGEPHFNRMISPQAVASPRLGPDVRSAEIVASLLPRRAPDGAGRAAREIVADVVRSDLSETTGREISCSDAEAIDGIQYFVFPNFVPWGGYAPLVYRFRPNGGDPATCIMEVILLQPAADQDRPPSAPPVELDYDAPFSSVAALGRLAEIFDQDLSNLTAMQRGLRASRSRQLNLAHYQESRIRHYLRTLDTYLEAPVGPGRPAPETTLNVRRS